MIKVQNLFASLRPPGERAAISSIVGRFSFEHLVDLVLFSGAWFWVQDANHRFTNIVRSLETTDETLVTDVIGRARWELEIEPIGMSLEEHQRCIEALPPHFVLHYRRKSGSKLVPFDTYSVFGVATRDEDDRFAGYIGIARCTTRQSAAEEAARTRANEVLDIVRHFPAGLSFVDADLRLRHFNDRFLEVCDLPAELASRDGATLEDLLRYNALRGEYGPGDPEAAVQTRLALARKRERHFFERSRPDGRVIEVKGEPTSSGGFVATYTDVTARKQFEQELAASRLALAQANEQLNDAHTELQSQYHTIAVQQSRIEAALAHMGQGLCMFDGEQRVVFANRRYGEIYGLSEDQVGPGTHLRDIVRARIANGVHYAGCTPAGCEAERLRPVLEATDYLWELADGRNIAVSRRPLPFGGWVTTHEDVTKRRQAERRAEYLSRHDALTDLANRAGFKKDLDKAFEDSARNGAVVSILLFDLDRFKEINDNLGHDAGDQVLKVVSERLRQAARADDIVARLGGDEFAIIPFGLTCENDLRTIALRAQMAIREPMTIAGCTVSVSVSIGSAIASAAHTTADTLLCLADFALYRSKDEGRDQYCHYDQSIDQMRRRKNDVEVAFQEQLASGNLIVRYEQIMDLDGRSELGVRAVPAMTVPADGRPNELDILDLARRIGKSWDLTKWVLNQVCKHAVDSGTSGTVSVECLADQVTNPKFITTVRATIDEHGLPAARLLIEVAGNDFAVSWRNLMQPLAALRRLGVRVGLSRIGQGHSIVGGIISCPIDRYTMQSTILDSPASALIINALNALAGRNRSIEIARSDGNASSDVSHVSVQRVDFKQTVAA